MAEELIGLVGLGAMGAAYAQRLIAAGGAVLGYDPSSAAQSRLRAIGGVVAESIEEVAERCEIIITALPSFEACETANRKIRSRPRLEGRVIDTNTLPRETKETARDALAQEGWIMLDCAVSGNPSMVLDDTYSFFLSGNRQGDNRVRPVIDRLASKVFDLGEFGNASIIKLIVNHLLMVHNAAAAEAMSLGIKAGLEPGLIYDIVTNSGGSSRMFEIRGKMMASGHYPDANVYELLIDKDGVAIGDLARSLRHPVPMFAGAYQAHMIGLAQGWGVSDASSMRAVYETLSGQRGVGPDQS